MKDFYDDDDWLPSVMLSEGIICGACGAMNPFPVAEECVNGPHERLVRVDILDLPTGGESL